MDLWEETPINGIPLCSGTITHIATPKTPEEGYHLSVDLVDKAILFLSQSRVRRSRKAMAFWLAFGACHAPHHVAKEWIERYKGKFDKGWDKVRRKR